eukprot:TRINITY_DN61197_c0_g1_i1.p1 TRINITY_DN61197_c0_g1~~TRINITY_DN61197_c0_g1_i1.p1  ORF type:complete len:503 (+),score=103.69 TRINITY_DN61197_c0_g1_i1:41-1510(+)
MGAAQLLPASNASQTENSKRMRSPTSQLSFFDVYEVGSLLGSGSFGQVRMCWPRDDPEKQKFAVKAIDTRSEMFEAAGIQISARKEASILQSVSHPHIVRLIESFEKERWLFLVMDCILGGELFQALANPRMAITEGCVANVGNQLLQALKHLHEHRVVHRDVKAENILLLDDPAKTCRWHIKLVDFGLALRTEQSSSFIFQMCHQEAPLEQLICGTAYYCAPEVWFHDYTPSVDIWAAGVVLYLALFGAFPFYDRDASKLEVLICEEDHEPSYRPVCEKDHPGFQVSNLAIESIKQLLAKAKEDRPDASEALRLPWVAAPKISEEGTQDWWPSSASTSTIQGNRCVAGVQLLGSWDQVIPPSLRAKAGRAALPPAVEAAKEQRRTQALEALKVRSLYGDSMKGVPTPNRSHSSIVRSRTSREDSTSSFLSRTSRSREMEATIGECGHLPELKGPGVPVLYEMASTVETFSDSEQEEPSHRRMLICACH